MDRRAGTYRDDELLSHDLVDPNLVGVEECGIINVGVLLNVFQVIIALALVLALFVLVVSGGEVI